MTLSFVRAVGLTRAGAMRSLAASLAKLDPDLLALSEIDAGNALALATRFDRQWAYGGGQALLWNRRFAADRIADRGLLRIDGRCDGVATTLYAMRFAADRGRIRDLRLARSAIRASGSAKVVFFGTDTPTGPIDFGDLGLSGDRMPNAGNLLVATRGCALESVHAMPPGNGLGAALVGRLTV